ncbi:MAG: prepilin-type N-terminal cleavage/methylation domain-containing protein [Puniceicoccales bacterium]|jgi:prepilin-type N-terminal cleavage/methylation domain-containing protein/prepilin-type processing-associated H-X9-DG protein|nr:prepilin-type N-terminal cleavage/methylation domain-containing protein [Puniceicoccales bacterium]
MDKRGKKNGFTLVELLIAIVIIGILMSLLIPAVSKVMESARRAKGANCLRQIAMAYGQYCNGDVNGRNIKTSEQTGLAWALVLAKADYLNDPSMYTFSGDSVATKVEKKSIVNSSLADNKAWGPSGPTEFSVYLIDNVPTDAPQSTTPIAFTRGLPTGNPAKWPKTGLTTGVYGDKGGYIVFLDGHVEWFEDLGKTDEGEGKLMKWGGIGTTNQIEDTIPSTAKILNASGVVKAGTGTGV